MDRKRKRIKRVTESDAAPIQLQEANSQVLRNVFGYLNVSQLKTVRKVNSTWDNEATAWLRKIAVAEFKSKLMYSTFSKTYFTDLNEKVPSFLKDMKKFQMQNFRLILPHYDISMHPFQTCPSQLQRFIKMFANNMKYLELSYPTTSREDVKFLIKTLGKLTNLLHLKLNLLDAKNCMENQVQSLWSGIEVMELKLKSLKYFEVSYSIFKYRVDISTKAYYTSIAWNILKVFPQLNSLALLCIGISPSLGDLRITSERLEIKISRDSIRHKRFDGFVDASLILHLPLSGLSRSHSSRFRLTRLEISLSVVENPSAIQRLFDYHSPNLKQFRFAVPVINVDEKDWSPVRIAMPIFPKLRKLVVEHHLEEEEDIGRLPIIAPNFNFTFVFVNDDLDYKIQFPELRDLTLGLDCNRDDLCEIIWEFYERFMPKHKICSQIEDLKLPCLDFSNLTMMSKNKVSLEIMDRLFKTFPSAQNLDLINAVGKCKKKIDKLSTRTTRPIATLRPRKSVCYYPKQ